MSEDKIDYNDVREYEDLFKLAPSFLLERFAKKNSNVVLKFKSQIESHLHKLNDAQKNKLDMILKKDVEELQAIMHEAYQISKVKQYKILANPKYKEFIEINLNEIRKILFND